MSSMQMINSIVEWERRIEFEQNNLGNHSSDFYGDWTAPVETAPKKTISFMERFSRLKKDQKPALTTRKDKPCKDPQPC